MFICFPGVSQFFFLFFLSSVLHQEAHFRAIGASVLGAHMLVWISVQILEDFGCELKPMFRGPGPEENQPYVGKLLATGSTSDFLPGSESLQDHRQEMKTR